MKWTPAIISEKMDFYGKIDQENANANNYFALDKTSFKYIKTKWNNLPSSKIRYVKHLLYRLLYRLLGKFHRNLLNVCKLYEVFFFLRMIYVILLKKFFLFISCRQRLSNKLPAASVKLFFKTKRYCLIKQMPFNHNNG
jgi:hypothetical protein